MMAHKPDPYVAFKDDDQRCKALESRDQRLVKVAIVIAVIVAILWGTPVGALAWLSSLV
jgi:hypothetical protein